MSSLFFRFHRLPSLHINESMNSFYRIFFFSGFFLLLILCRNEINKEEGERHMKHVSTKETETFSSHRGQACSEKTHFLLHIQSFFYWIRTFAVKSRDDAFYYRSLTSEVKRKFCIVSRCVRCSALFSQGNRTHTVYVKRDLSFTFLYLCRPVCGAIGKGINRRALTNFGSRGK